MWYTRFNSTRFTECLPGTVNFSNALYVFGYEANAFSASGVPPSVGIKL